jgi:methanogenic corrinoid protein MtbC1
VPDSQADRLQPHAPASDVPTRTTSAAPANGLSQKTGAFRDVLRRTVEGDVVPRLLVQLRTIPGGTGAPEVDLRGLPKGAFPPFMEALRHRDDARMRSYLSHLIAHGWSAEVLIRDLITPAARRMGELWETDDCNFVEVTLTCARLQRAVLDLGRRSAPWLDEPAKGRVLVCGLPDDHHTLGGIVMAEMLTRDGWRVTLASPFASAEPRGSYDLVCFSLASSDRVDRAARVIQALRRRQNAPVRILVGGSALTRNPQLVEVLSGDGWAEDAASAVAWANERVCGRREGEAIGDGR